MPAHRPAEICRIFQRGMAEGDLATVLGNYDHEAVFVDQSRAVTSGRAALERALAAQVAAKQRFDYTIKSVTEADGIALMHTEWTLCGATPMTVYAIEVARRQADGTWKWLIGDPFTVGQEHRT
jgi:ketosteroid isomerase-like protein